mmetsp:Transcript_1431/g.3450  ORF Transcript_1431/g.3450 Transcript_1431/m.3450 type:complete len:248 (-) Transcript_1431:846-1589(-)
MSNTVKKFCRLNGLALACKYPTRCCVPTPLCGISVLSVTEGAMLVVRHQAANRLGSAIDSPMCTGRNVAKRVNSWRLIVLERLTSMRDIILRIVSSSAGMPAEVRACSNSSMVMTPSPSRSKALNAFSMPRLRMLKNALKSGQSTFESWSTSSSFMSSRRYSGVQGKPSFKRAARSSELLMYPSRPQNSANTSQSCSSPAATRNCFVPSPISPAFLLLSRRLVLASFSSAAVPGGSCCPTCNSSQAR